MIVYLKVITKKASYQPQYEALDVNI